MQSDDSWLYHLQSNPFYNRNTLFCTEQGTNENFIHISNHHIFDFDWDKMFIMEGRDLFPFSAHCHSY